MKYRLPAWLFSELYGLHPALPHIPGDLLNGTGKIAAVPDLGKHVGKFPPDRVILHNNIGETRLLIFF